MDWMQIWHPRVSKLIQRDFVIIKTSTLTKFSSLVPGLQHLQRLDKSVQHFASFMSRQVCNRRERESEMGGLKELLLISFEAIPIDVIDISTTVFIY